MNKILVPIKDFSQLSLSAAYFAVEFSKRNPTKILFFIVSPSGEGEPGPGKNTKPWPKSFDDLIQQARAEKINIDLFFSNEGTLETIARFARDHHISEIIIAVPPAYEPIYSAMNQQIEALRNSVESQIVIVRPKEERRMTADWNPKEEEKLTSPKSRTITEADKEGI